MRAHKQKETYRTSYDTEKKASFVGNLAVFSPAHLSQNKSPKSPKSTRNKKQRVSVKHVRPVVTNMTHRESNKNNDVIYNPWFTDHQDSHKMMMIAETNENTN